MARMEGKKKNGFQNDIQNDFQWICRRLCDTLAEGKPPKQPWNVEWLAAVTTEERTVCSGSGFVTRLGAAMIPFLILTCHSGVNSN